MALLLGIVLILGIVLLLILIEKNTGGKNGGVGCVTVGFVAVIGVLVWWQLTQPKHDTSSRGAIPGVSRPIGLQLETINATNAARLRLDRGWGWYVAGVEPSSPAAAAGLRKGDFVLSAEGKWLSQLVSGDPLFTAKDGKTSGSSIRLWGYRDHGASVQQWTWDVRLP